MKSIKSRQRKYCPEMSNELRTQIITMYDDGNTITKLAQLFRRPRTTISSIIHKIKKTNCIDKGLRGGMRKKILTEENKRYICKMVNDDCTLPLRQIAQNLWVEKGIKCCIKTVNRALQQFHFTLKRVRRYPVKRNNPEAINQRYIYVMNYLNMLKTMKEENIFFIDEAEFSLSMRGTHGQAPRGNRAIKIVPGIRTKNISICAAMNISGIQLYEVQQNSYNSSKFTEFLKKVCDILKEKCIIPCTIVLDNVAFHKTNDVKEIIKKYEGFNILFYPHIAHF